MMDELTIKQRAWAEAYLETLNGTEAARRAKYKGNTSTLGVIGHENLRKPKIRKYIEARLAQMVMAANEVLMRLTEEASVTMNDFVEIRDGSVRVRTDALATKGHLVRKIRETKHGIELELYSAQRALELLGKYHALFKEMRIELDWRKDALDAGLSPGDLFEEFIQTVIMPKLQADTNE